MIITLMIQVLVVIQWKINKPKFKTKNEMFIYFITINIHVL